MALKNIVVAENDSRFVLNPKAKDEGARTKLNATQSAAVRKHVQEYVQADSRDLSTYTERLGENLRVALKLGNGMVPGIRAAIEGKPGAKMAKNAAKQAHAKAIVQQDEHAYNREMADDYTPMDLEEAKAYIAAKRAAAKPKKSQSVEQAMLEAEKRDAVMTAALPEHRRKAIASELAKYGHSIA